MQLICLGETRHSFGVTLLSRNHFFNESKNQNRDPNSTQSTRDPDRCPPVSGPAVQREAEITEEKVLFDYTEKWQ